MPIELYSTPGRLAATRLPANHTPTGALPQAAATPAIHVGGATRLKRICPWTGFPSSIPLQYHPHFAEYFFRCHQQRPDVLGGKAADVSDAEAFGFGQLAGVNQHPPF